MASFVWPRFLSNISRDANKAKKYAQSETDNTP